VYGEGGLEERSKQNSMAFETLVEWENNGKRCMYLMCDLNERRLKDSSIFCCIYILLESVEGRIMDIIQIKCLFELVVLHVSKTESNEAYPLVAFGVLNY
jgi:hypothetical protein